MSQIQLYYLISQSHLIQQSHLFSSFTNSILYLITQSYLFQQTRHILQCHKFGCIIQFHSLFSFNSSLYSTVSQIQLYYLIPQSNLIQQFHIFNNVTNLIVLSRFTFSSLSTVAIIQYCHKFSCISSFTFISLSTVQTYSTVSQIQLYYLIPQSNLIQQFHIFNNVTISIVLSRFTFSSLSTDALIQYCHKFSCISGLH